MTDVERSITKTSVRIGLLAFAVAGLTLGTGCPDTGTGGDGGTTKDLTGSPIDMTMTTDGGTPVLPLGCSRDGWCWQFPAPQGNGLLATWGSSAQDVWAVGGAGTIVHFDGSKWSIVRSPTNNTLYSIWGSAPNNVFAVGDRGTVLRWDGTSWTQLQLGAEGTDVAQLYGVWGADGSEVWFVGNHLKAGAAILRWNGTTVTRLTAPVTWGLRNVWGASKTSAYIVGDGGTLLHWDGSSWTKFGPMMTASWSSISGLSDNNFFLATRSGLIYRWNGTSLGQVYVVPNPLSGINNLWSDGASVFAAGDIRYPNSLLTPPDPTVREGMLLKWDGTTFNRLTSTPKVHWTGQWGPSGSNMFLVGASGTTGRFDGTNFTTSSVLGDLTGNSGAMYGIAASSTGELLAVGDSGGTLRGMPGSWQPAPGAISLRLYSVTRAGSEMLSVGYNLATNKGQALKWSGSTWTAETIPTSSRLLKVTSDGTNSYAVGDDKTFLVRTGGTWSSVLVPLLGNPTLRDVFALDSKNVWIVGGGDKTDVGETPTVLFYNGSSLVVIPLPSRYAASAIIRGVWAANTNNVFMTGEDLGGTEGTPILKWDQGSKTWLEFSARTNPITTQALSGVWGRSANDVYAVGKDGLVLHFDGTSWNYEQSGTDNNLVSISGTATEAYITGTGGSILRKTLK